MERVARHGAEMSEQANYERTAQGRRRFRCGNCGKQFNKRTGRLLHRAPVNRKKRVRLRREAVFSLPQRKICCNLPCYGETKAQQIVSDGCWLAADWCRSQLIIGQAPQRQSWHIGMGEFPMICGDPIRAAAPPILF
jgi:hypothetical protein